MKTSNPNFLYEIGLGSSDDIRIFISKLSNCLPDIQIYTYQNPDGNHYIFFETPLDFQNVCQKLSFFIEEQFIVSLKLPELHSETTVYYTSLPPALRNFDAFVHYVKSFVKSFKPSELSDAIGYSVKCDTIYDAARLIAVSQAIPFPNSNHEMIVDTSLLKMPIVEILNSHIDIQTIEENAHTTPLLFYGSIGKTLLVFPDLLTAERIINILNGGTLKKTLEFVIARHYVDLPTITELEKYEVKFPIIRYNFNTLSSQKQQLLETYQTAFNIAKAFGKVFSLSCKVKHLKAYGFVVYENKDNSIQLLSQTTFPAKYVNRSFFISSLPPATTKQEIMALFQGIEPISIVPYTLKTRQEQKEKSFLPFQKLTFDRIEKVEQALKRIKTSQFPHYQPFCFQRKEEFIKTYERITSKTSLIISNISHECTLESLLEKCTTYGKIRFVSFTKSTGFGVALVSYSKPNEMQKAKTQLNQLVFHGNHLNVVVAQQIRLESCYLVKGSTDEMPMPNDVYLSILRHLRIEIPDFAKRKSYE